MVDPLSVEELKVWLMRVLAYVHLPRDYLFHEPLRLIRCEDPRYALAILVLYTL